MQQFKEHFKNENIKGTISNIQSCIRLNDIDEIEDGNHLIHFDMLGFFSFREKSIEETISFWMDFLKHIGIKPDYVTVHPDKIQWKDFYSSYDLEIREDLECIWSDGEIGGYCTEFYKDGLEIGNIVNTIDTCIDVGFGLERIEFVLNNERSTKEKTLVKSISKIIESGYTPGHYKQGFILKKLIKTCIKEGIFIDNDFFIQEKIKIERISYTFERLWSMERYRSKPKEWWWNTHGIDLDLFL